MSRRVLLITAFQHFPPAPPGTAPAILYLGVECFDDGTTYLWHALPDGSRDIKRSPGKFREKPWSIRFLTPIDFVMEDICFAHNWSPTNEVPL